MHPHKINSDLQYAIYSYVCMYMKRDNLEVETIRKLMKQES